MVYEPEGSAPRRNCSRGAGPAAIAFALVCVFAAVAGAQGLPPAVAVPVVPTPVDPDPPSFRTFVRGLGMSFTTSLFSRQNLDTAVVGGAAAALVAPLDQDISSAAFGTFRSLGTVGEAAGGKIAMASIVGGTVLVSQVSGNRRLRSTAFALTQATVVELVIVESTKYITGRERPDGSDALSFPSGHSAAAFTVAAVFSHYYGWKWGVPLYTAAAAIAASRVEKGKHWPSDVVAGATIGLLAGRSGIRTTERLGGARKSSRVSIAPILGDHCWGISVSVLPRPR